MKEIHLFIKCVENERGLAIQSMQHEVQYAPSNEDIFNIGMALMNVYKERVFAGENNEEARRLAKEEIHRLMTEDQNPYYSKEQMEKAKIKRDKYPYQFLFSKEYEKTIDFDIGLFSDRESGFLVNYDSDFFHFDENVINEKEGVYLMNDFYIGRSVNIYRRIKEHISSAIRGVSTNKDLEKSIISCFREQTGIHIKLIDKCMKNESYWIQSLQKEGYPIVNKTYSIK